MGPIAWRNRGVGVLLICVIRPRGARPLVVVKALVAALGRVHGCLHAWRSRF